MNMKNSIFVLEPKRSRYGVWTFDDANTGLVNEPFVGETNTLIDCMVLEKQDELKLPETGNIQSDISLIFSANPFPGSQVELTLIETSPGGSTYRCEELDLTPWLCPAAFLYYPVVPEKLYAMVRI